MAHAGGARLGVYSNSKEAIDDAIMSGFKVIEIDISRTSDGELVLSHDFRPNMEWIYTSSQPSVQEFKDTKINDTLTPLTFAEFVREYSQRDEEVWYMIDPKENLGDFDFVQYAKANVPVEFLGRCVYQIYGIKELSKFVDDCPFGALHYCLDYFCKDGQRLEDVVALIPVWKRLGVHSVSFGDKNARTAELKDVIKLLRDNGIHVSVFGVNSEMNYLSWKDFGVDCINTDYLYPAVSGSGVRNITGSQK